MENEIKEDRRIRKSKRAIRQALVKMLSQKNLEDITITEISKEADVNRKTFYNYYKTTYQIENDIVRSFEEVLSNINIKEDLKQPIKIFETLTSIIQNDFEFYSDLIKSQKVGGNILISRISDVFKQRVRAVLPVEKFEDDFTMELSINFIIAGMLEVYKVWLQDSKGISLEKLSKGMSTIIFLGLNGVITEGE